MTVFNKFARSFKSHWLLYLCVIVFGITNLVASSGAHMVQRLLFFVLTILACGKAEEETSKPATDTEVATEEKEEVKEEAAAEE